MAPITEAFVANIHHFIHARGLDLVSFGKGEDKDAIAHKYLAASGGKEGVLFVGRAQEKAWAVPYPEAPEPGHREGVPVADPRHAAGQLLLLLLRGCGLRTVLSPCVQDALRHVRGAREHAAVRLL